MINATTPTNIRYGEPGKILFEVNGVTCSIKEPSDVVIVGWPNAAAWLRKHYGFLFQFVQKI